MSIRRAILAICGAAILAVAGAFAFANWPETALPEGTRADRVVVYKSERKMDLLSNGQVLRTYSIALGGQPVGHKSQEGDGKTPEGTYTIDYRNLGSQFHLSLHISYPNAVDTTQAKARGVSPGGMVMIHGLRNGIGAIGRFHRLTDWTNGCIAVTNREIEEIVRVVPDNTPIEIKS